MKNALDARLSSDQIAAVYRTMGEAVYAFQLLRQEVANYLIHIRLIGTPPRSRSETARIVDEVELLSTQALVTAVTREGSLPPIVMHELQGSSASFDELTLRFFALHAEDFLSKEGRSQMLSELHDLSDRFSTIETEIAELRDVLSKQLGVLEFAAKSLEESLNRAAERDSYAEESKTASEPPSEDDPGVHVLYSTVFACSRLSGPPDLLRALQISPEELAPVAAQTLSFLSRQDKADALCWKTQSLIEFQDLLDLSIPRSGPFLNINFFFYEGLSAFREGLVTGLNGSFHASFAVLRSALELLLLHSWWKIKRSHADSYEQFYEWLNGSRVAPSFSKILEECLQSAPPDSLASESVRDLYRRLSSYTHKPALMEAVTWLRGSNAFRHSARILVIWLQIVDEFLQTAMELLVIASPQSLFPIDVPRYFGFSPPVGLFFDADNTAALQKGLGEAAFDSYHQFFSNADDPKTVLEWALSRKPLTDDEIFATWTEDQPLPDADTEENRIHLGWMTIKAKMRAISQMMAYNMNPEMEWNPRVDFEPFD